jgi:hypothetical protein
MTVASPLSFPGSRVVAGWWRQLASLQPQAFWIGHFLLQRVEALVEVSRPLPLDPFARLVLQALTLPGSRTPGGLDARLHLGSQVILRVLHRLEADALARPRTNEEWEVAPLARQALDREGADLPTQERRLFPFVSPWLESEGTGRVPHFLDMSATSFPLSPAADDGTFDPTVLAACVERPAEWKQRHAFPADVRAVLMPEPGGSPTPRDSIPEWQQVILVRPEHLPAVLVLVPAQAGGERLIGFCVRTESWSLQAPEPAFALGTGWQETFPELAAEFPDEAWRRAWRAWCQPRSVPLAEADACTLERRGCRLHIQAPRRLVDRLRAARSDAFKGEAWLLAGTGSLRMLALLEVLEAEPSSH